MNDILSDTNPNEEFKRNEVCSCGRAFSHCKACGSKNVYVKKSRSFDESFAAGRNITVYGCRRCMRESTSEQTCKAASREFSPQFTVESKVKEVKKNVWGNAKPGSPEHVLALNEWVSENGSKKGWDSVRVYVEAQKAGFHLEAFGDSLDPDIRKALEEQGLLEGAGVARLPSQSGGIGRERPADSLPETEAPSISLEEIIKNMRKDS